MKKLMIAAVAVAMAAVASASTTKWGFNTAATGTLKDGYKKAADSGYTPQKMAGATLYLIDATMSYGGKTGQAALLLALADGKSLADYAIKGQTEAGEGKPLSAVTATTDANGQIKASNDNVGVFYREDIDTSTGSLSGFAAILVTDGDNKYVYLGETSTAAALANPDSRSDIGKTTANSTNFRTTDTFVSAGWYAVSVPEPTSGLLLLLGVAGLALKRKRA